MLELGDPRLRCSVELGELLESDAAVDVDFIDLQFKDVEPFRRVT